MDKNELKDLLERALRQAIRETDHLPNDRYRNASRSRSFVRCVARFLKERYATDVTSRVSLAGDPKEFLHDISISQVELIDAPKHKVKLKRVVKLLWQIEVEMSNSGRDFLEDLNKLRAGTVDSNKLYVVRQSWSTVEPHFQWAIEQVSRVADQQEGQFFLGFIPHPADWDKSEPSVALLVYPFS